MNINDLSLATMVATLLGTIAPLRAAPVLAPVDFSKCANTSYTVGGPTGSTIGNANTKDAALRFTLLDPTAGNNVWVGGAKGTLTIKLSVAAPTAVYLLMNTLYGQAGIGNARVYFKGTNATHHDFVLTGNKTIRDYNNWVWTDTLNGTTAQEWWTNNVNPTPDDQSHRIDAHLFNIAKTFAGQTLTTIVIRAPANAGVNFMEPVLFAVGMRYAGGVTPVSATCLAK